MWSLIKKNLWLWKPNRGANLYVFGFLLLFSCLDGFFHFSAEAWLGISLMSILLTQGAASSVISVDSKENNDLFLEYLPVRWSQLWLANWVDGLVFSLLMVPCLCWCRVITWTPSLQNEFEDPIFKTRWVLPVGLACGTYLLNSYAMMWRTFFRSEKAAIFLTVIGEVFFVAIPVGMLAYMAVLPGLWDVWPLLLIQATAFSLCSFLIFAKVPRHWSGIKRFVCAGVPAIIATAVLFYGGLWLGCLRWQHLEWTERDLTALVIVGTGKNPALYVTVRSSRSFNHPFLCNPATGDVQPLDRNLELLSGLEDLGEENPIILQNSIRLPEWHIHSSITAYFPKMRQSAVLLPDGTIDDGAGSPITIDNTAVSCGKILFSGYDSKRPTERFLCITDLRGKIEKQWSFPATDARPIHNDSGKVLMVAFGTGGGETQSAIQYRLYDLNTRTDTVFKLPGRPICFSKDLSLCACLETVGKGDLNDRLISLIDIPTLNRRVILPVGVLSAEAKTRCARSDPLSIQAAFGGAETYGDPAISFDEGLHRAVLLLNRFDGATTLYSIMTLDTRTLIRTILVQETCFPQHANTPFYNVFANPPSLSGLTLDGTSCIFQNGDQLMVVATTPGPNLATPHGTKLDLSGHERFTLSPSGKRVLLTRTQRGMDDGKLDQRASVEQIGKPETHFELPKNSTFQWFDDDHFIMISGVDVSITDEHGRVQRNLLPPQ